MKRRRIMYKSQVKGKRKMATFYLPADKVAFHQLSGSVKKFLVEKFFERIFTIRIVSGRFHPGYMDNSRAVKEINRFYILYNLFYEEGDPINKLRNFLEEIKDRMEEQEVYFRLGEDEWL